MRATPASAPTIKHVVSGAFGVRVPEEEAADLPSTESAEPALPPAETDAVPPWSERFPLKARVVTGILLVAVIFVIVLSSRGGSSSGGESDGYDTGLVGGVSAQGLDSSPTVDSMNSASVCYTESDRDPSICDSYYQAGMSDANNLLYQAESLTNFTPECFGRVAAFQTTLNTTVQPTGYNWDAYVTAATKIAQGANDVTYYC